MVISGLVKDRLLKRSSHSGDRRRQNLKLTPKAQTLLTDLLPDYWSRIHTLMGGLSEEEEKTMESETIKVETFSPAFPIMTVDTKFYRQVLFSQ